MIKKIPTLRLAIIEYVGSWYNGERIKQETRRVILVNITVLNCIPNEFYSTVEKNIKLLTEKDLNNKYDVFTVRDLDIKYCCGCWSCWVKTPGKCIQKDDMPRILRSMINSDLTIFISPIVMGFVSSLQKKISDKMIPLVHPYIKICENECHHQARYDKYPKLGLLLIEDDLVKKEDVAIINQIYNRTALNMKTELSFSVLTKGSLEELEYEIKNI